MKLEHKDIQKIFKLKDSENNEYYTSETNPTGVFMTHKEYKSVIDKYPNSKYVVEEFDLHLIGRDVGSIMTCMENMISQLNQIFGADIMGWHCINYKVNSVWWTYDNSEVSHVDLKEADMTKEEMFAHLEKHEEHDQQYAFEVYGTSVWYADGFTAFVGDDNGYRDIFIFRNDLKFKLE